MQKGHAHKLEAITKLGRKENKQHHQQIKLRNEKNFQNGRLKIHTPNRQILICVDAQTLRI